MPATRIEATYRVVTPLFSAGADSTRPEVRLSSIKGVLRYWWRALAWSRCGGDLDVVRREEDRLFGSTGGGQSRVIMRLASVPDPREPVAVGDVLTVSRKGGGVVGDGARYLGYGVMGAFGVKAGRLTRACLRAPFDLTVQMRVRGLNEPELTSLGGALVALGTLGGLGAKSRKGYGSVVLESLCMDGEALWSKPRSVDELKNAVAALRSDHAAGSGSLPEFTALSSGARHVLLSSAKSEALELLDLIGRELVRFRSWGHRGRVLGGIESEKNFRPDHDLMRSASHERRIHPERIAFGLPHNYGKQKVGPADELDRRASPLFIHVHECGDRPVAVLSFLPARFLPADRATISVGGSRVPQASEEKLYRPIDDFLDRLLDRNRQRPRQEPFTDAVEVRW